MDNIADFGGRASANIIEGSLYFWDHFAGETHILREYVGGYATYNLIGGNPAISNDYRILVTNDVSTNLPERYIPVSQGFFVVAVSGGTVSFKNSQREFVREEVTGGNTGSYFFKSSGKNTKNNQEKVTIPIDERVRIRLGFESPLGYYRQILVGLDERTTDGYDIGFDAPLIEDNEEDMYWVIDDEKYVIQGVNNFDLGQELKLGVKIGEKSKAIIKIDTLENTPDHLELYIYDKLIDETYEITNSSFEFELEPGTYNDRFALVFEPKLLSVDEVGLEEGVQTYMDNVNSELKVNRIVDTEIKSIVLFNYIGQQIRVWKKNLTSRNISLPVKEATGPYIIQVNTSNGSFQKSVIIE